MNSLRSHVMLTLFCGLFVSATATFAQDIRDKVQSSAAASANEPVIDTQGIVYGVPFGTTEDDVIQKFGKPSGYIRLDTHRTALLYGKSYSLLCYDGSFDALIIDRSILNPAIGQWATESAPFISEGWHLSNGVKSEMNLKEVKEIVKGEPANRNHRLTFSTEQCLVQLGFSHWTDRGEGDEAYNLYSLLMARIHDGKDYWSEPPQNLSIAKTMKGKKVLGMRIVDSDNGILVDTVFPGSPAAKAGIHPGDLITGLNGESVIGMKMAEFNQRMGDQSVVKLEVTKDNNKRTVEVERVDASTLPN